MKSFLSRYVFAISNDETGIISLIPKLKAVEITVVALSKSTTTTIVF